MTLNRHKNYLLSATALVALLVVARPSLAAETADAPVQEILVTAQKRTEALKSAPLSISVISGQVYGQAGGRDLRDLQTLTSSLIITATANEAQTTARLRGVGTVGDNPGLDSSVGVVIDGVTRARTATAMSDLGEVERIEILKGPQSTLFGRNASAGLISVITKAPTFAPSSEAELTLGNRGLKGGSVSVTGPLSDQIAGRLYVAKRERDGQYSLRTGAGPRTDREDGDTNYFTTRGQLLFVPHDRAQVRIIADYTRRDEACCTGVMITRGATANWIDGLAPDEGVAPVANPGARVAWSNRSTRQKLVDMGLSAETTLELDGGLKLTSLTAARFWDHNNGYDADFSTADIYYRNDEGSFGNRFETLSQELRLEGQAGALDWSGGVYLASERLERRDEYLYGKDYEPYIGFLLSGGADAAWVSSLTGLANGQSFLPGLGSRDVYTQTSNTLAVYSQNSLALRPDLVLTGGIRVTREDKTLTSDHVNTDQGRACSAAQARGSAGQAVLCLPWSNPAFNALTYAQHQSETATSGTIKLAWTPVPDLMTYLSYSRGWKAGGFNLDREQTATFAADTDTRFGSETVDAYELGAKWRGFGGALAVDAALFHQAFKDFQLNTFLGTTFLVK
ncbi:MAG: TonB-dependent receptor, partial [Asticcacaulis sp.]